jgi:hypothetical protein
MPLLFSYGTLQCDDVQVSTFGRTLVGNKDELLGFERSVVRIQDTEFVRLSGTAHHAVARPTGNPEERIVGTVFELTDVELANADKYEPAGYKRVYAGLASGRQVWVYIDATFAGES